MERFAPAAIVFDMDGLLVDSEPLWCRVEQAFVAARGGVLTEEEAATYVGRGIPWVLEHMRGRFGFAIDPVADLEAIVDAFVARASELALKPGARALLDRLSGRVPVALASSSVRRLVDASLRATGVASYFGAIASGDEVAALKPAPDLFLLAAARLGVDPARCLVLEDSPSGVLGARRAGMAVIAVPELAPGDRFSEASLVVGSLDEASARIELAS
jgi:HAD superfamily hydrolase (TIGR01509 family)